MNIPRSFHERRQLTMRNDARYTQYSFLTISAIWIEFDELVFGRFWVQHSSKVGRGNRILPKTSQRKKTWLAAYVLL